MSDRGSQVLRSLVHKHVTARTEPSGWDFYSPQNSLSGAGNVHVDQSNLKSLGSSYSLSASNLFSPTSTIVGKPSYRSNSTLNVSESSLPFDMKLNTRLFNLKLLVSQFAIHLDTVERTRLFKRLDRLVSPKTWHEEDELPNEASVRTFLRWLLLTRWQEWIALGFSHSGNLLLAWRVNQDEVTAEFIPADKIRWTISNAVEGRTSVAAGSLDIRDFPTRIRSLLGQNWS